MKLVQPYDGRYFPPTFAPAPLGYRIKRTPRDEKLWTFCETHAAAMVALNTLRAQGYRKAEVEALYL
jgi:hypothetical protein